MGTRPTYTTRRVRAADLRNDDVALIDGTWSWVSAMYDETSDSRVPAPEYADEPEVWEKIQAGISQGNDGPGCTYVVVRYLRTHISPYRTDLLHHTQEPEFKLTVLSMYDLVEIQEEEEPK